MKCEYCGVEFEPEDYRGGRKYCSDKCREDKHKEEMRIHYIGKRENVCRYCGIELPKFKTRFCCAEHGKMYNRLKKGSCQSYEMVKKTCIVCGKEFETYKQSRVTCSDECSKINKYHRQYRSTEDYKAKRAEYDRQKYLKKHPDARTRVEIQAESKIRKQKEKEESLKHRKERDEKRQKILAEKEAIKQANIKYWQQYEAEHECVVCGNKYIAHHPFAKYCSESCIRKAQRKRTGNRKHRYKEITVDKDINLYKLAQRDHNQCQICGLFVNWNDFEKTDTTIICGNMYPSIDHILPISLGGLHSWDNVQLAHRGCNTRKSNKYIG